MFRMIALSGITLLSLCVLTSCGPDNSNNTQSGHMDIITSQLQVKTQDNLSLSVQYYFPKTEEKLPVVILLHMLDKDKSSWNQFIRPLLNNNYAVYAVDLRGHGRSIFMQNGETVFYNSMNEN